MLLAAGRGQRMRPLSDHKPKPLLCVRGRPLLDWHIQALVRAGVGQIVVNTAWLGEQVADYVAGLTCISATSHPQPLSRKGRGGGAQHVRTSFVQEHPAVVCSHEGRDFGYALETAGGIARALPLLDSDIFWLVAGDVFAPDFSFAATAAQRFAASEALAHLWLVPNPPQHPAGDFALSAAGQIQNTSVGDDQQSYTYSTIALLRAVLFAPPWCAIAHGNPLGVVAPLAPVLRTAIAAGRVTGELYTGRWVDVGTPERLAALNQH